MTDEVNELLNALHQGTITLDEVAQKFRTRKWPRRHKSRTDSYVDLATAELQDPDPHIPGSFDDVAAAFHQNRISRDQFRALSEAVADAQRAEDAAGQG